jgi:(p)ppGpp synthase/HD superfamily hydrolase
MVLAMITEVRVVLIKLADRFTIADEAIFEARKTRSHFAGNVLTFMRRLHTASEWVKSQRT